MVLLTFVWKCFQDRNFHGVVVGLYEQSIESWVGLVLTLFSTRVKVSAYANPFIELAPVLDATAQINSCITTNKNTHIFFTNQIIYSHLIPYTLEKLTRPL